MKMARMLVSVELLLDALSLPYGTEIRLAKMHDVRTVELTVSHPDLNDLPDTSEIPLCSPVFQRKETILIDWGQSDE